jgi:hypothetical protein
VDDHGKLRNPASAHFTNDGRKNLDKPRSREPALRPAIPKPPKSKTNPIFHRLQSSHLNNSKSLRNDFRKTQNWLRLGSFSPYSMPYSSVSYPTNPTLRPHRHANAFLPNEPKDLLKTKETNPAHRSTFHPESRLQ